VSAAALVAVLEEQTRLSRELVEILQADQQRILRQEIAALEASSAAKEALALRMHAAEQTRRRATEALARELGLPDGPDTRVSALVARLGAEGGALERAADNLRAVVGSLRELVALSRGFLEQSILGIRGLLQLLHSLRAPQPPTYDALGRMAQQSDPGAVALRREA
jgi:flagellar biosynthesis/type III secretory pathway chaperone